MLILDAWPEALSPLALAGWLHSARICAYSSPSVHPISSTAATHLHLGPLDEADAAALFLHEPTGIGEEARPTHASSIEVPDDLDGLLPATIERRKPESSQTHYSQTTAICLSAKRAMDIGLADVNERMTLALGCA